MVKQVRSSLGKALIVSGSSDANVQMLAFAINQKIGSEAFLSSKPLFVQATSNKGIDKLFSDLDKGECGRFDDSFGQSSLYSC